MLIMELLFRFIPQPHDYLEPTRVIFQNFHMGQVRVRDWGGIRVHDNVYSNQRSEEDLIKVPILIPKSLLRRSK